MTTDSDLDMFKSLMMVDPKLFMEEQECKTCPIGSYRSNKYLGVAWNTGKLGVCGTYDDSIPSILFVGLNPSYRRFDFKLRPMFPKTLDEHSTGAFFVNALFEAKFFNDYKNVYFTNIVKCSTPENRELTETEIKNCKKWFDKELELVKPRYIVALGSRSFITVQPYMNEYLNNDINSYKYIVLQMKHPSYYFRSNDSDGMFDEIKSLIARLQLAEERF